MIKILKIVMLLLLVKTGLFQGEEISENKIVHRVEVIHPGIDPVMPVERFLVQLKGQNGKAKSYFMDVETVVCGDANCRVDTVRIFWDKYGFYDRLVLPKGIQLEKAEGENFNSGDYKKLDNILSNKKAGLKDVFKEEIVDAGTGEGVDAISGATILLNNEDYVKGAVWTCYTLWHWVNGDVFQNIRRITGREMSPDNLMSLIKTHELSANYFALEELVRRKVVNDQIVNEVLNQLTVNDYQFSKLVLKYLELGSDSLYNTSIERFFIMGDDKQKVLCLTALSHTDHLKFPRLLESIGTELSSADDFQILDLFLILLDNNEEVVTQVIIDKLFPLVLEDNFLIARRVFWFLQAKQLSEDQSKKMEEFLKINKGKL